KLRRTEIVMFPCAKPGGTQHARNAARTSRTVLMGLSVGSACVNVLAIETELAMTAIETAEARTCRMPCRLASVPTAHFSDATTQAPLTRAETDTRRKLLISTGRLR